MHDKRTNGFPPLLGAGPRVLILGSLPSQLSLRSGQYYGNPQNAFWSIMGELFGAVPDLPYKERTSILVSQGIAVWDVLANSIRPGSMDAAIDKSSAVINDFEEFFAQQPKIRLLCFNGQTAARMFKDNIAEKVRASVQEIECVTLPSTSPAHASMSFTDKLAAWSVISLENENQNYV